MSKPTKKISRSLAWYRRERAKDSAGLLAKRRARYARDKLVIQEKRWIQLYGINRAQWTALLAEQNNRCPVCGDNNPKRWVVDHCHDTGAVRGILCAECNWTLGKLGDNEAEIVERLARFLLYLRKAL